MKMFKYCPNCGYQNNNEAGFCASCGGKFQENIQTYNQNQPYNYQGQAQTYIPKKSSKKLLLILPIISVIVIIILLLVFLNPFAQSSAQEAKEYEGPGPTINLQSLTNGNAIAVPDEGRTATYGFYLGNQKLGDISYTSVGKYTYEGQECNKIVGTGTINYEYYTYSIGFTYDYYAYISTSDNTLLYSEFSYDYTQPTPYEMEMSVSIDKVNGEITTTVNGVDTVSKMPDYYWDLDSENNLYVGYEEEIEYSVDSSGYSYDATMQISIPKQEDVIVPAGKFSDCYKIIYQVDIDYGISTSTTIWVNENWIAPKMELGTSISEMGGLSLSMSAQLISYN